MAGEGAALTSVMLSTPHLSGEGMRDLGRYAAGGSATIDAYAVDAHAEQLPNWMSSERFPPKLQRLVLQSVLEMGGDILIIKGMAVDEEVRGQGHGGALLDAVLAESEAQAGFLIADLHESQQDGFDVVRFYESRGFVSVTRTENGDVFMVWPEDFAEKFQHSPGAQEALDLTAGGPSP